MRPTRPHRIVKAARETIFTFQSTHDVIAGSLDASLAGKLGGRAMAYYISTTCIAVTQGFIFVYAIRPGASSGDSRNATVDMLQVR